MRDPNKPLDTQERKIINAMKVSYIENGGTLLFRDLNNFTDLLLAQLTHIEGSLNALLQERDKLRMALLPGEPPCDCCENQSYKAMGRYWSYNCQCGNPDDRCEAAAWCRAANRYEEATGLPCPIEG